MVKYGLRPLQKISVTEKEIKMEVYTAIIFLGEMMNSGLKEFAHLEDFLSELFDLC